MALGVAREGSEPSLFFDVTRESSTLLAAGWFVHPELPELFELEVWTGKDEPKHEATFLVQLKPDEKSKKPWKTSIKLEIKRDLRPHQD